MFRKKKKKEEHNLSILEEISRKYRLVRFAELFLGCFLVAVTFNLFLLPNNIIFGGVSGLSIAINELFGIEPSRFIMIASLSLLVVSYFVLGKEKTKGSVIGSLLFPLFIELTKNIGDYIDISNNEMLLSVLFAAVLYGFGVGLVFRAGFTTGGSDIINHIIAKYGRISLGNAITIGEGAIISSGFFVFGATKLLYGLLGVYIMGIIADRILLGISASKAFYIVTKEEEKMKNFVLQKLGHGVTVFDAKGGYDEKDKKVLLCVIPNSEYYVLKEGIHLIDEESFFVATDAYEVFGGE